jgi:hypothetical protein
LGLTGYYRKFIHHYGILAKPFTNLLKKKQFEWSPEAQRAFDTLKHAMTITLVLAILDFNEQFIVETYACDLGIGVVLMQHDRCITYLSKALGPLHQKLSVYEKEFLALIIAVERWRPYLQGQEFLIRTDHKSLAYLTEQNLHSEMQRKAMTRLMGLQFKVVYRKGKENLAVDALSRVCHLLHIQAISEVTPKWLQEVVNSYTTDPQSQQLLSQLAISSPDENGYTLDKGLIKCKDKVWIAKNSALQTKLIASMHSSAVGGHSGIKETYQRLKKLFHWKGLKSGVESYVRHVNKPSIRTYILLGCYNHYPYLKKLCRISQWIS